MINNCEIDGKPAEGCRDGSRPKSPERVPKINAGKHASETRRHPCASSGQIRPPHLGWIAQEAGDNAAKKEYQRALQLPVRSHEFLPQAYWNLAKVFEQEKNCGDAVLSARDVIDSEISDGNVTGRSMRATDLIARMNGTSDCSVRVNR